MWSKKHLHAYFPQKSTIILSRRGTLELRVHWSILYLQPLWHYSNSSTTLAPSWRNLGFPLSPGREGRSLKLRLRTPHYVVPRWWRSPLIENNYTGPQLAGQGLFFWAAIWYHITKRDVSSPKSYHFCVGLKPRLACLLPVLGLVYTWPSTPGLHSNLRLSRLPHGGHNASGCSCALTWSMHLVIFVNNAMSQAHGFALIIKYCQINSLIINANPCAWLMALLTKIMRCILQVRAQEQPCLFRSKSQTKKDSDFFAPRKDTDYTLI